MKGMSSDHPHQHHHHPHHHHSVQFSKINSAHRHVQYNSTNSYINQQHHIANLAFKSNINTDITSTHNHSNHNINHNQNNILSIRGGSTHNLSPNLIKFSPPPLPPPPPTANYSMDVSDNSASPTTNPNYPHPNSLNDNLNISCTSTDALKGTGPNAKYTISAINPATRSTDHHHRQQSSFTSAASDPKHSSANLSLG
jgi:hypothetical protein